MRSSRSASTFSSADKRRLEHELLRRVRHLGERRRIAHEAAVHGVERARVAAVDGEARHRVHELVAGRAVDAPASQQLLVRREDLLDHEIHRLAQQLGARAQQLAVADRVEHPVDVIEPQAVDVAARDQLEHQAVRVAEAVRVLHAHRGERVDVEEAPVVDLLGGDLPRRGPPVLRVDDALDERLARRRRARRIEPGGVRARVGGFGFAEQPPQRRGGGAARDVIRHRVERREQRRERCERRGLARRRASARTSAARAGSGARSSAARSRRPRTPSAARRRRARRRTAGRGTAAAPCRAAPRAAASSRRRSSRRSASPRPTSAGPATTRCRRRRRPCGWERSPGCVPCRARAACRRTRGIRRACRSRG